MSTLNSLIKIRAGLESDQSLIFASFLRGLYYDNKFYNMIPKDDFMATYKEAIKALLTKCEIRVACLVDDPDVIVGYSLVSPASLHWVYVKKPWRKQGIGKLLVPVIPPFFSHFSTLGLSLKESKNYNTIFNPFKL